MLNVGGTKNLLFESLFHGAAKNLCSMALQDVVQPIDVVEPLPGSAVNDLGEIEKSRLSEFQQLLALQITLAALARYRRHHGRAMRGERGTLVGNEFPWMVDFISARHDAYAIGVQVQRRRHANGLGRHGVRMAIMQNRTRWSYIDRNAKRQIFRMQLQGTKSGGLCGKTHGGDYARRAAGTLLIHFTMPFDELLCEILLIVEAAHFEEGGLYETHQVFNCAYRKLHPAIFQPNVTHCHIPIAWLAALSFIFLNVADFKGIRAG